MDAIDSNILALKSSPSKRLLEVGENSMVMVVSSLKLLSKNGGEKCKTILLVKNNQLYVNGRHIRITVQENNYFLLEDFHFCKSESIYHEAATLAR
ncbi:hypothetical protein N9K77_01850 [bacterium]|nr:hypothetical protein [bacterium]